MPDKQRAKAPNQRNLHEIVLFLQSEDNSTPYRLLLQKRNRLNEHLFSLSKY